MITNEITVAKAKAFDELMAQYDGVCKQLEQSGFAVDVTPFMRGVVTQGHSLFMRHLHGDGGNDG